MSNIRCQVGSVVTQRKYHEQNSFVFMLDNIPESNVRLGFQKKRDFTLRDLVVAWHVTKVENNISQIKQFCG